MVAKANAFQFDPQPANNTDDTGNGGVATIDPNQPDDLFHSGFEDIEF
jgi:hypothetical protein